MSCSVCAGHSSYNCPCCGSGSVNWVECPDCEKGLTYHSISIRSGKEVKVTAVAYQILPFDEDDIDPMDRCLEITVDVVDWAVELVYPEF